MFRRKLDEPRYAITERRGVGAWRFVLTDHGTVIDVYRSERVAEHFGRALIDGAAHVEMFAAVGCRVVPN